MNRTPECQDARRARLLDAMSAIAWSASATTFQFTYVNPAAEKMLGYPVEQWLENPNFWTEHLHPDDRYVASLCHNYTVAGRDHELVYRMIAADGRAIWLRDYVNVHLVDGVPAELFGVMVDITERVLARQALEASEQRYRELVDGVSDILYTLDNDGCFVSLSRSFERSTGQRIDAWIGRPFTDLFTPRQTNNLSGWTRENLRRTLLPGVMDSLDQALDGEAGVTREYDLPAESGAVVMVEVSSQPRYVDGVVAGTIGMARDVTEQRTIARKLEEAKRLSSLGQVTASLAHEFNNVLMGIQPFVEVIARSTPHTRGIDDALAHITRAISRGKRASQEVLRFANPKEPQLFSIDVQLWLPTLLGQLVAALPPSIALTHTVGPGVSFIRGDRDHLEQAITNLVFNAREAIVGSGTIHVDVSAVVSPGDRAQADFVRISVSDDGPGIAPQMIDRIFEPLFTTKRNGTGLGLAIARRLMEGQGGTLTAANRPERGSVFELSVPAAEEDAPVMHASPSATPGVTRILLVEDDLSVGTGLEELLNSQGYETTWVRAAGDACEAARRTRPQVAIIDVNLPDGNGIDLVPLLRAELADLPVVLSTGHVELSLTNEKRRILSLMKPYELDDLLTAISSVTAAA